MDTTQLAQMVSWLDEEHRRDRGEVAKLQQRIESLNVEMLSLIHISEPTRPY